MNKKLTAVLGVIAMIGILLNIFLILDHEHRIDICESSYEWNIEREESGEYDHVYAAEDKAAIRVLRIAEVVAILSIIVYALCIFLSKIKAIFLVIPIAEFVAQALVFFMYDANKYYAPVDRKEQSIVLLLAMIVLAFSILTVAKNKVFPGILLIIVSIGCGVIGLKFYRRFETLLFCNSIGNAIILLPVLVSGRSAAKKAKKPSADAVSAQAPKPMGDAPAFCTACGAPVNEGNSFCGKCGARLIPETQTATKAVKGPAETGFLTMDAYVIDEKVTLSASGKVFNVYDTEGRTVGTVREGISDGAKAARALFGREMGNLQSISYSVTTLDGAVVLAITKKGIGAAEIYDGDGNFVSTLVRGTLKNRAGEKLGAAKIGLLNTVSVTDANGNVVGEIKKKWNGAKTVFTTADKYLVSVSPSASPNTRISVIGTALIYEIVLGNR